MWLVGLAIYANAQETGLASVYSPKFENKSTASGDVFNHAKLTASHRKYPFGTSIKITSVESGRSVIAKITDRGPFINGYLTNISGAIASKLGINAENTEMRVKIEVVNESTSEGLSTHKNISPTKKKTDTPPSVNPKSVPQEYRYFNNDNVHYGNPMIKKKVML